MIEAPNKLTTSGQSYHNFGPSSSNNNYTATTHPVITALRMIQKIICECCERVGHKSDACIIRGPKSLLLSIRIKMNQFNNLHGYEPTDPPGEWNRKPPAAHFKYKTSPPKTSPVVSAIIGRLNHHVLDNGDVEVHPSDFPV